MKHDVNILPIIDAFTRNLLEDIRSGSALAWLVANYPIMTLHTPLVSRSGYPITAQHRWHKSPESAVIPFYAY